MCTETFTRLGAVVALVCTVGWGCIEEQARRSADAADTNAGPACGRDEDCAKFANACNSSSCIEGTCRSEPVVCDDHNVCTTDRCDASRGCVFEAREAGTPCLDELSLACDGAVWHLADRCDTAGRCVDGGTETCDAVGAPAQCQERVCVEAVGCQLAPVANGAPCVVGGRSDTCVGGVRYDADQCVDGECVDGGSEVCEADFCAVPECSGQECGSKPIGIDVDIAGAWTVFQLVTDASGQPLATRFEVELSAGGEVAITSMLASVGELRPTRGAYCVSTDATLQLVWAYDNGAQSRLSGHVSRGKDLAVLTEAGRSGLSVFVKKRPVSEAKKLTGTFRIVGLDRVVLPDMTQIDSLLGGVVLDASWCIVSGAVSLGRVELVLPLVTTERRCLVLVGDNAVDLDIDVVGDRRVWSGVVGPEGHYAVMQRRGDDGLPLPSLIVLVREGLANAEWYSGDYATARLDVNPQSTTVTDGAQTVDGAGNVIALAEPDWILGPDDEAHYQVSADVPLSGLLEAVTIGDKSRRRVGQLGQVKSNKADWFVDLACDPTNTSFDGPPRGASLRLGVRVP